MITDCETWLCIPITAIVKVVSAPAAVTACSYVVMTAGLGTPRNHIKWYTHTSYISYNNWNSNTAALLLLGLQHSKLGASICSSSSPLLHVEAKICISSGLYIIKCSHSSIQQTYFILRISKT